MFTKLRLAALAAPTLALGASLAVAGSSPAHAVVTEEDNVRITTQGFDFGNGFWIGLAAEPSGSGEVSFDVRGGSVDPLLTGTLHLTDAANDCARMRIDYINDDDWIFHTAYGGLKCTGTNSHQEFPIYLGPFSSPDTVRVKVSIESQLSNGNFTIIGSDWADLAED